MRAHAAALVTDAWRVTLIAYVEASLPDAREAGLEVVALADPLGERARAARGSARVLWAGLRLAQVAWGLWRALGARQWDAVLVQNPPALPTLAVARAACAWSGARLIVDWHNFGRAMLALRMGDGLVVRVAGWLERTLARGAAGHLCVTEAMRAELARAWAVDARVLADGSRADVVQIRRDAARRRLAELVEVPADAVVVVTATSWTLDEAHELLVEALDLCGARGGAGARVVAIMTGRGAGRAAFARRLEQRPAGAPRVELLWAAEDDYRAILRGADLGISLHRSASGVDFPMKIVDMQAAGLPVLALDYGAALHEGFAEGHDGWTFRDAAGLADLLDRLAGDGGARDALRASVGPGECWDAAWARVARPVVEGS